MEPSCRQRIVFASLVLTFASRVFAQSASDGETQSIRDRLQALQGTVVNLRANAAAGRLLPDVEIHAKAAEWIVRHGEFYRPTYAAWAIEAIDAGQERARRLGAGAADWEQSPGRKVLAYRSVVDESVQPYAITIPGPFGQEPERRWPLHVVLHGRDGALNEVSFIHNHRAQPVSSEQDWIQLDVFGRTNNAYRWAGESDVFEALEDVQRRYRIDERRIVLHGFSMGGAGSWHLGLHHPSLWCSVGPGAGFVDFYAYQKVTTPLPDYQDRALHIYNAVDYALNAFHVPVCTYGGEFDAQLVASTTMVAAAAKLNVPIKLLIGPGVEHKFHPETQKEFMAFHHERQVAGRRPSRDVEKIRFVTHTVKYHRCEWATIEEQLEPYRPSQIEARIDGASGRLIVQTKNVAVLQVARDVAEEIELDGQRFPLLQAAGGLLPGVYYEGGSGAWRMLDYDASLNFPANTDMHKRHNVQGPIDDAFMQPFVCVRGTGTPWNAAHAAWANWTLERFAGEFDKGMRGHVPILNDIDVTEELIRSKSLILFGDPGSNSVLAQIAPRLPVKWTPGALSVDGQTYNPSEHGLSLIYPNPLYPRRYVVINSGHTFHADAFAKSNAWLFPRLGDIAVQKFAKRDDAGFAEEVVWAGIFDSHWKLPQKSN